MYQHGNDGQEGGERNYHWGTKGKSHCAQGLPMHDVFLHGPEAPLLCMLRTMLPDMKNFKIRS